VGWKWEWELKHRDQEQSCADLWAFVGRQESVRLVREGSQDMVSRLEEGNPIWQRLAWQPQVSDLYFEEACWRGVGVEERTINSRRDLENGINAGDESGSN
jgi:hypothetical protein